MNVPHRGVVKLDETKLERLGPILRRIFIAPSITGNRHLKFAQVSMQPGQVSPPHHHIGDEVVYTLSGVGECTLEGKRHLLEKETAFVAPPGVPHQIEVVSNEPWIAICAYCDECPIPQKYLMETEKI